MRFLIGIFCVFLLSSCDFFIKKNENLNKQLDTIIDFTSVDFAPSFKICDSIIEKTLKNDCFISTLHQKLGEALQVHQLQLNDTVVHQVTAHILVDATGKISLDSLINSSLDSIQSKKIDSIFKMGVASLPQVFPATKRGIPVKTKYVLPIKINVNH